MNKASTIIEKSLKSINPCLALPILQGGGRQACKSVVQTSYDIIKAHGGALMVETLPANQEGKGGEGSEFIVRLPYTI